LAADYPYHLASYHTRKFPYGAELARPFGAKAVLEMLNRTFPQFDDVAEEGNSPFSSTSTGFFHQHLASS